MCVCIVITFIVRDLNVFLLFWIRISLLKLNESLLLIHEFLEHIVFI